MFNHLSKSIHNWQCTCASDLGTNSIGGKHNTETQFVLRRCWKEAHVMCEDLQKAVSIVSDVAKDLERDQYDFTYDKYTNAL